MRFFWSWNSQGFARSHFGSASAQLNHAYLQPLPAHRVGKHIAACMAGRPPLRVKDNERETIVAAVNARSAVQTTLSAFAKTAAAAPAGRSVNWQRKLASDELYAIPRTLTAYGTVCQTMAVPGKECDLELYFASPFALLSLAASRSNKLADLLVNMAAATPTGKLEFVFYLDKATPGNQRRPDV